jgi:hypothetical protein
MHSTNEQPCDQAAPVANWKCIYFTLALSMGYWYLPPRNKWVLLALLYFPYIALAYYDHWYQCRRNMGPTYLALFYHWTKPQDSKQIQTYKNWCPNIKNKVLAIDGLILLTAAVLFPYFLKWKPT